jgi:hypothetical protein
VRPAALSNPSWEGTHLRSHNLRPKRTRISYFALRLSVERAACRSSKPRVFTGNPGERSREICGPFSRDSHTLFSRRAIFTNRKSHF